MNHKKSITQLHRMDGFAFNFPTKMSKRKIYNIQFKDLKLPIERNESIKNHDQISNEKNYLQDPFSQKKFNENLF